MVRKKLCQKCHLEVNELAQKTAEMKENLAAKQMMNNEEDGFNFGK